MELFDSEWKAMTNNAKATYVENKLNLPDDLPSEADVKLFKDFCISQIRIICDKFDQSPNDFTATSYRQLARLTVARAITFNARRGAETSKLTIEQWKSVEDGRWKKSGEIEKITDPVEKKLAERLNLCYVPGKKKKGKSGLVPILFTPELVSAIRILLQKRETIGLTEETKYVFATSHTSRLKSWDVLHGVGKQVDGLEAPHLLTPTRTRKYLATMLQLLDMSDGELTWVTNHMGHTKNTHIAWYRKESSTIELTKMARILTAVDEGENLQSRKINELGTSSKNVEGIKIALIST